VTRTPRGAQARRFSLIRSELQQGTNQILQLVTWGADPRRAAPDPLRVLPQPRREAAIGRNIAAGAGVVLAAIAALTLWRRFGRLR
jgi:hypothetical protein